MPTPRLLPRALRAVAPSVRRHASMDGNTADVAVCGAGIMGLNVAYQLKCAYPQLRVVLLERQRGLGHGSSGWSTGFMRAYYSNEDTMRLALDGISAYKRWGEYTGLNQVRTSFTETGALWLMGHTREQNAAMQEQLKRFNVTSHLLDAAGVQKMYPVVNTDPYPEFDSDGEETGRKYGSCEALF
eukprot:CAMPEP_0206259004 /NCGR_PEP_ID=MMETSP0047_2-20121206/26239_1 /ASSEMBLY_ACC=CAM_ASM_000192 /TAXON_ID=195065 /ORGANISM="Chroomonas mesostigmatica_cf, Strain CCMP1168" /LENGTH=184 /DNA_ID=CAMNT_0053685821 /DNA_START=57 /DNA_END=608 /DNA_ORIENTATION=+